MASRKWSKVIAYLTIAMLFAFAFSSIALLLFGQSAKARIEFIAIQPVNGAIAIEYHGTVMNGFALCVNPNKSC